jgi:hypothetical protein
MPASRRKNKDRSEHPAINALGVDELGHVALHLDPVALRALRASSKAMRTRLEGVAVDEWLCATDTKDSFCFDPSVNHFTKTHVAVPVDIGPLLVGARWSAGDVAFVGFEKKLLCRRVPHGEFCDITPPRVHAGDGIIKFAAGWQRNVWVGTGSAIVHALLTSSLDAIERVVSEAEVEEKDVSAFIGRAQTVTASSAASATIATPKRCASGLAPLGGRSRGSQSTSPLRKNAAHRSSPLSAPMA